MRTFTILLLGILLAGTSASVSFGQNVSWVKLGETSRNLGVDNANMFPSGDAGAMSELKFKCKNVAIKVSRVVIGFRDGSSQNVALNHQFTAGGECPSITLNCTNCIITKIQVFYQGTATENRSAVIEAWAKPGTAPRK
jgi:hypothetical protein